MCTVSMHGYYAAVKSVCSCYSCTTILACCLAEFAMITEYNEKNKRYNTNPFDHSTTNRLLLCMILRHIAFCMTSAVKTVLFRKLPSQQVSHAEIVIPYFWFRFCSNYVTFHDHFTFKIDNSWYQSKLFFVCLLPFPEYSKQVLTCQLNEFKFYIISRKYLIATEKNDHF